jgi:hypothetical protein
MDSSHVLDKVGKSGALKILLKQRVGTSKLGKVNGA